MGVVVVGGGGGGGGGGLMIESPPSYVRITTSLIKFIFLFFIFNFLLFKLNFHNNFYKYLLLQKLPKVKVTTGK